ncbi:hypothetical protein O6052_17615, partial [Salmonella enterica subsp. enterica]
SHGGGWAVGGGSKGGAGDGRVVVRGGGGGGGGGGGADTVSDSSLENLADGIASGFVFEDSNAWSLLRAIRRAFVLWSRPSLWRFVQRQAMAMDFSWQVAAKSYRELYYRLK